jgi:hypothetical protein
MNTANRFETLSDAAFAHLGQNNIAYIKATEIDGGTYFVLTSAAGQDILVAETSTAAIAAGYERGLTVLTRH